MHGRVESVLWPMTRAIKEAEGYFNEREIREEKNCKGGKETYQDKEPWKERKENMTYACEPRSIHRLLPIAQRKPPDPHNFGVCYSTCGVILFAVSMANILFTEYLACGSTQIDL